MRRMDVFAVVALLAISACDLIAHSGTQNALSGNQIIERVTPAAVLILVGTGDGQLAGIGSGVILRQDALYVRPEIRTWGMRIMDDRNGADICIDVRRPFLTYDWEYKMIHTRSGTVLGTGKVLAIDGPAAAQRLAIEIVNRIRSARPLAPQK